VQPAARPGTGDRGVAELAVACRQSVAGADRAGTVGRPPFA
jgi:hypothetical protein